MKLIPLSEINQRNQLQLICRHCGQPLRIEGEYTVYFDAWHEQTAEFAIINGQTQRVTDVTVAKGEGDTIDSDDEWRRLCCGAPITEEEIAEWELDGYLFD